MIEPGEKWEIGDRIRCKGSSRWTTDDGETCFDGYEVEGEVVSVDEYQVNWKQTKVLRVHKQNPHVTLSALVPDGGGFSRRCRIEWITRIGPAPPERPLWVREFGQEYAVPEEVTKLVAAGVLEDSSWHNDVCPSFTFGDGGEFVLWCNHPDEDPETGRRFAVCLNTYSDQNDGRDYEEYYSGNQIEVALDTVWKLLNGKGN